MKMLIPMITVLAALAAAPDVLAGDPAPWSLDTLSETPLVGDSQIIFDNSGGSTDVTVTVYNGEGSTGTVKVKVRGTSEPEMTINTNSSIGVVVEAGKKLEINLTGTDAVASGTFTIP